MNLPVGRSPDHASGSDEPGRTASARDAAQRRRLDEVFGDVLPETTGDERHITRRSDDEHWYRENRPPHHG